MPGVTQVPNVRFSDSLDSMVATRSAGERLVDGLEAVGQLGKRAAAEATGMSEGTVSKKAKVHDLMHRCWVVQGRPSRLKPSNHTLMFTSPAP